MKKLARMDEVLKKRVVGQEEAVELITDAIRRSRTGISDPNRPHWLVYVSRSDRGGKKRSSQNRLLHFCLMTRML